MCYNSVKDMKKIKVAYFEPYMPYEDYAVNPSGYGGGACFARWAKEFWNGDDEFEFYIFAPANCFRNVVPQTEKHEYCIPISEEVFSSIKNGEPLKGLIDNIEQFDIVMHHGMNVHFNTDGLDVKQVCWTPMGTIEEASDLIDHVFCYRGNQNPSRSGQYTYRIQLGKPVPTEFVPCRDKEDIIFQCTRHDRQMNTIEVIEQCIENRIRFYFAGPAMQDDEFGKNYEWMSRMGDENKYYPIWDHLGEEVITYLGNPISEDMKLEFNKKARLTSFLFKRSPSFNQSAIESLAQGTPILVPKEDLPERRHDDFMHPGDILENEQWLKNLVQEGDTGFLFDGTNFAECFERAKDTSPLKCWEVAREYDVMNMLSSFETAVKQVMDT